MKYTAAILICSAFGFGLPAQAGEEAWRADGFAQPESALWDAARGHIYVSNIAGAPEAADGAGWISLLGADGRVIAPQWSKGFDAPKGMALAGGALWVADITRLRRIDPDSGALLPSVELPGAVFLNDVAADVDGEGVYVSDMMTGVIWRADAQGAVPYVSGLGLPNGIAVAQGVLFVATWGEGLHADFRTDHAGGLFRVDPASQEVTPVPGGGGLGNLDGLIADAQGGLIFSDFMAGRIARLAQGDLREIAAPGLGSADIAAGDGVILVPMMMDNTLIALPNTN